MHPGHAFKPHLPVLNFGLASAVNQIFGVRKIVIIVGSNQSLKRGFYAFASNAFGNGHLIAITRLRKESDVRHHGERIPPRFFED